MLFGDMILRVRNGNGSDLNTANFRVDNQIFMQRFQRKRGLDVSIQGVHGFQYQSMCKFIPTFPSNHLPTYPLTQCM